MRAAVTTLDSGGFAGRAPDAVVCMLFSRCRRGVRVGVSRVIVRMALLSILHGIVVTVIVAMSSSSMAVPDIVEQDQSDQVRGQTETADDEHQLWVGNFLRLDESLNGVQEDGHTQRDEEDSIDQCSQCLRTLVSICVHFRRRALVCHFDGPKTHAE